MFEYPILILFVLVVGATTAFAKTFGKSQQARRAAVAGSAGQGANPARARRDGLDLISQVEWQAKPLMNKSEYRTFRQLEHLVGQSGQGRRVFSQVALGEVFRTGRDSADADTRKRAFQNLNRKRVDFLIIDNCGMPVAAVEYQGGGHYQGDAPARDHVKREAFRRIGVPFIEVPATGMTQGQIVDMRRLLGLGVSVAAE